MKKTGFDQTSDYEKLSSLFDGADTDLSSLKFQDIHKSKWKTFSLISDSIKYPNEKYNLNESFLSKVSTAVANEPKHSKYKLSNLTHFLSRINKKVPILIAGPAFAAGLVLVTFQPSDNTIVIVEDRDTPISMESYCKLHENGAGGLALC